MQDDPFAPPPSQFPPGPPPPSLSADIDRPPPVRLASVDAFRGLVMLLLLAEALRLGTVSERLPESGFWSFLAYHQSHVAWVGCALHDLIQPSFSFLVGVALAFSIANRSRAGQSRVRMGAHALGRAVTLVLLGIFLRSLGHAQTRFTFEDTLTQIGLGYFFLYLLALRPARDRWIALAAILAACWAAFALYPLPGPDFDTSEVGVPKDWPHLLGGFEAHWNKNTNLAWAFDVWFLNLFPRESTFRFNGGGYATLSFIPTLGTMILGLLAGGLLRGGRPRWVKASALLAGGLAALTLGWALGELGVCPVVKRIWTPSWTIYSGGWCLLLLGGSFVLVEGLRLRAPSFPLVVMGRNSIAAYLMEWLAVGFVATNLDVHLGRGTFLILGEPYETLLRGGLTVLILWGVLFWMYRRRIFLKI